MERSFDAIGRRQAKRRALNYWYRNREALGMSLAEFLRHCRLSTRGPVTRIVFTADPGSA